MDSLGSRVKAEREAKEWSQQELAERVTKAGFRIKQSAIGNIEMRGDTSPKCIVQLAAVLGVTPVWLQTGKGNKMPPPDERKLDGSQGAKIIPLESDHTLVTAAVPLVVWRSVASGDRAGEVLIYKEKAGLTTRPVELEFSKDAFSFRIMDDEAEPKYERRDLLLIDPDPAVAPGDNCLFVRDPKGTPLIGMPRRLIRISPLHWTVKRYEKDAPEHNLSRQTWKAAWFIFGSYSRR